MLTHFSLTFEKTTEYSAVTSSLTQHLPQVTTRCLRLLLRTGGLSMLGLMSQALLLLLASTASAQSSNHYAPPGGFSSPERPASFYGKPINHDRPLVAEQPVDPRARPATNYASAPLPSRSASEPASFSAPEQPLPIANASAGSSLKLPPRQAPKTLERAKAPTSSTSALMTMGGALAAVLGLFFCLVVLSKKFQPAGGGALPKEAIEVLGRTTLAGRQQLQLVRVGGKLILVALTAGSAETLTEITDPHEVERLTAMCRRSQPGSSTQTFQQVVSEIEREPVSRGFLGENSSSRGGSSSGSARRIS